MWYPLGYRILRITRILHVKSSDPLVSVVNVILNGQPMPWPVRSSRQSEPSPGTSVNAPDFSARW